MSHTVGFKPAKHMVFSGLYPADGSDFEALNHAIERLTCNDASVSVTKESSTALGLGFRCGFLGLLHMDVFHQRLEQVTLPSFATCRATKLLSYSYEFKVRACYVVIVVKEQLRRHLVFAWLLFHNSKN